MVLMNQIPFDLFSQYYYSLPYRDDNLLIYKNIVNEIMCKVSWAPWRPPPDPSYVLSMAARALINFQNMKGNMLRVQIVILANHFVIVTVHLAHFAR